LHVSNFAEIQDWCVGYHGTKTDSSWYPPGNWLPPLPHSSEQPHAADEPNVPSVVHDNAGLRASHDPPRALSLEPIHVQTEVDMDSFCPTDSEQRAHLAVKRVRWADTSDEVTASAFSCAIEVIVGSTPPRSVHGGDGDRAEFAIQLKMPHTAASSRCFLAGGIVADISRMLTGHGTQSPHST